MSTYLGFSSFRTAAWPCFVSYIDHFSRALSAAASFVCERFPLMKEGTAFEFTALRELANYIILYHCAF